MSDFALESWEVPPGVDVGKAKTFGPVGPFAWKGARMMFLLKLVPVDSTRSMVFFRANNQSKNYAVVSGGDTCQPTLLASQSPPEKAVRVLKHVIGSGEGCFGRVFYLEGELCVARKKSMGWLKPVGYLAEFRVPFNPMAGQSVRVFEWLRKEWSKPKSEARFAYEWSRLDAEQTHEYYCQHVPHWREVHDLMRLVAQMEGLPEGQRWWHDHIELPDDPEREARFLSWGARFWEHYIGQYWSSKPFPSKSAKCLLESFETACYTANVKGTVTTAHERLEARLQLRDWLERNAPERMEELLPS